MFKSQKGFYNQAGIWWGPSDITQQYKKRAEKVEEILGSKKLDILDLGVGNGGTSAAMAELGHNVVGIEFAEERAKQAEKFVGKIKNGKLSIVKGDFYTHNFDKKFDLVTYWDGFGVGSDRDQKIILDRISKEWLKPGGSLLMDVYCPYGPISEEGSCEELSKLPNVEGSVDMIRKVHFDFLRSRWIDEWQPKNDPESSMSQDLRCYTPEDFELLIEDNGLKIISVEVDGKIIPEDLDPQKTQSVFENCWSYFVRLSL